ncbi:conserved Plasmodium protein, unknown function [Plasmodium berghei]|uniref:Uncharacterized protein n=2 Tax=Plasmodium berghei TaxID=5821 RepID=A0A509AP56_PLABA|nr:conserved Plasmodium protein, unknown function [Plasmodium berghei ANKA]CXI99307.1 conserved Plasmodium protein, unknown function [Plasmodium berghei]SCL97852.1 conserved Plasmodium protein, unknown function [Plasmodium berghei]SCM16695.1 conserved Plasmodium protein, unknown function [Plasmodium berghei]SCM18493.1 conserved Plasmodium protein, unknown function [Plasmodium berghei]SCN27926.1 conserved Plasmodium protein, unknown function [Plasmodium berghei]|eukprot:XP_034423578.1 conserved Plasmodium protein, unknown function [Plasmodium berghei ANKA]
MSDNNDKNKCGGIKNILESIKESENTKDKFINILKLTKNINELNENDKLTVLKAVDPEFLCLLLRSKNEFKLFTIRLINSLVSTSTCIFLKRCIPYVNSIIYYYLTHIKNVNKKLKGFEKKTDKQNDNTHDNYQNEEYDAFEYECDTKDINILYNESLTFFLKIEPLLKNEYFIKTTYVNYENNDIDVDVEMYFFKKKLKKKYIEENDIQDLNCQQISSGSELEEQSDSSIFEDNNENNNSKEDGFCFPNEQICLIELFFDILKENIAIQIEKKRETKIEESQTSLQKCAEKICSEIGNSENVIKQNIDDLNIENILLTKDNINVSLLFLNNIILKVNYTKFIKEYFNLLNQIIENYGEEDIIDTAINCLTNLNIYIKNKNFQNVLNKNQIYKFYANVIYLFSEIKNIKKKKNLYKLYSTIYTCLNYIYENKNSSGIFKTPLSYMNVELYIFFEDVIKYLNNEKKHNFIFITNQFDGMIQLICNNIYNVVNFLNQCYLVSDKNGLRKNVEKYSTEKNHDQKINAAKSVGKFENVDKIDQWKNEEICKMEANDIYIIMTKIKRSIELLVEFFKDIKNIFKPCNKNCENFIAFKKKFDKEINSLICLFCNYLIHENVHYIDDFFNLLELFTICLEEQNFFYLVMVIKHIDADHYFNNKQFLTKVFLYIFNISMKNIIHINILFNLFNKCTYNVIDFIQINTQYCNINCTSNIYQKFKQNAKKEYDLIQISHIPIDKLNNISFVYLISQDEYNKKNNKETVENIINFSKNFFIYYYFNILHKNQEKVLSEIFDIYKDNYFNINNNYIQKNDQTFFLSIKVLLTISSLLFIRFDPFIVTSILDNHEIFFIQDCLIISLFNLKASKDDKKNNELMWINKKREKYFLKTLKLVYFLLYYNPYFVSLFIFRLKQAKHVSGNISFEITNTKMAKEHHISICAVLNKLVESYV